MASTYLSLVNSVLTRLRESTVSTVTQTPYSTLIGALVNDAKRECEEAWQWSHLFDYLTFSCIAGITSYETNTMVTRYAAPPISAVAGSPDRTRLWIDPVENVPLLFNATANFEKRLTFEPILNNQVQKLQAANGAVTNSPPSLWQLQQSTFYNTNGMWNKQVRLWAPPDAAYTMQLYIVNPQNYLQNDADVMKIPTAPVVQKAYLYALYERGEELGESLTLTAQKTEATLADAISADSQLQSMGLSLSIPYGAQY